MEQKEKKKRDIVVAVSGGFDPIHIGHVRLFRAAKKLGDKLVVILNNDNWLLKKKGNFFMPQHERREVLEALANVDEVITTDHPRDPDDMSVCAALEALCPDVFANGGDRTRKNIPELAVFKKINCKTVFGVGKGGKIQSSSGLLKKYADETQKQKPPQ